MLVFPTPPMPTVQTPPTLPWATASPLAVPFPHGHLVVRKLSPTLPVKLSISPSARLAVKPFGYDNFCVKSIFLNPIPLYSSVTTMVPRHFCPTLLIIPRANILMSAITLSTNTLKTVPLSYGMSPVTTTSPISLPRLYCIPISLVCGPILDFGDSGVRRSISGWCLNFNLLILSRFHFDHASR